MKKILIHARYDDYKKIIPLLENFYHVDVEEKDFIQIKIFVPDAEINNALEILREPLDFRYKETLIEVSTPDFVISSTLSRAEKNVRTTEKTPVEKLLDTAKDYIKLDYWNISLTAIAGLIALTGLFLNNVAIIIGAMLLSPILGPIHSFAIYSAVGKTTEAIRSIGVLSILLLSVFVVSVIGTYLLSFLVAFCPEPILSIELTQEIISRTVSSPVYILMAVLLGIASIIALSRGTAEFIAGVAIAAALLPPTVVAGISFVIIPTEFMGPVFLVLDNVLGLIAGALIATLILGITPRNGTDIKTAKKFIQRTALLIAVLIALLTASYIF
ncbi:TIGR00341 family protein [Methanoplanus sp. FWC-SCC4]|uniref:TIGR00341 family protein n=1 Tax=Methanochimaera problematica TaxID=2609417 RepID=A0AA97I2X1_9EURY|nr:TIGR00341 family protein [Methanoplanus sp. FWC-SCC4]WOF16048.1 TIGR00341 family protein [Methanoplanus sp. FWC-SCC4]